MKYILFVFCFILTLVSCQNNTIDPSKITALYIGDERIFCHDYWGMEASYLMFLPLVIEEGDVERKTNGSLAEKWEHSEDYREWTYYLRNGVKWHDGVPVTAHDIKFTMDLRMSGVADTLRPYSAQVVDDYTLTVSYKKPTDGTKEEDVYYPKHLLKNLDPNDFFNWDFWTEPIGNGPYRYVRHMSKTMMEVESNPDYYLGEPKIKHLVFKFAENMNLIELLSGNVDILPYVERDLLIKLDGDERFESYYWIGNMAHCIYWNHNNPLFENLRIRRALTMAINRKELLQVMNYPEELPIIDALITNRQLIENNYPEPIPYDPEKAVQILEEEGWQLANGEDVRKRNGETFKFIMLTGGENALIPLYVQDQFRRIGIQMEIQDLDNNVFRQRAFLGEYEAVSFQASLTPYKNPNWDHYKVYAHTSLFGYDNPQIDSLLQIADTIFDSGKLDTTYYQIANIFNEDIPITFLFQIVFTFIVKHEIKGLESPYMSNPVYNMEHLWIDGSK